MKILSLSSMQIKHLTNVEIDYKLWDERLSECHNQLSYAYTWYLDIVSVGWEALVSEDYEYIMPLPIKKKYGIPYLVQPILSQQLGVFSKFPIDNEILNLFLAKISNISCEIHLNESNFHENFIPLPNYLLSLTPPYQDLKKSFSKNSVRNIIKSQSNGLYIHSQMSTDDFLTFYFSNENSFKPSHQPVVKKLIAKGQSQNLMSLYGVKNAENDTIAALCVLHSNQRLTYLLPISNAEGKKKCAMFLLVNHLLQEHAGSNLVFDFEGSMIEGIARFYKGFGAKYQPYFILKRWRPSFLIGKLN